MERQFDPEIHEWMDRPQIDRQELADGLASLEEINRRFGSYRLLRMFLHHWVKPGRVWRILDLATGFGDIPRMIVDDARRRGITVRIEAVDSHKTTLELAREASRGYPEIEYVQGDIREYESPATCDVVLCTLALHHFSERDAVRILRRMLASAHGHVLVSDLERSRFSYAGVWLTTQFFITHPMTRHDGRMSVLRAFTFRELAEMARDAGWSGFGHHRIFPARQALWLNTERDAPVGEIGEPEFA